MLCPPLYGAGGRVLIRVPPRLTVLDRPPTVAAAMRSAQHIASKGGLRCSLRNGCGKLVFKPDLVHLVEVVEAMDAHASAAVIILGR